MPLLFGKWLGTSKQRRTEMLEEMHCLGDSTPGVVSYL
jgi:hypothetical protein